MLSYILFCLFNILFLFTFHPLYTLKTIKHVYEELKTGKVRALEINISRGLGLRNKMFCTTEVMNVVEPIELEDQIDNEEEDTEFGIVTKRTRHFVITKIIVYIYPFK